MDSEFASKRQLFFGEVEGLADFHFIVDAWKIKDFGKFMADFIKDRIAVSDTDNMFCPGIMEDSSCWFWVTAGYKY